MIYYIISDIHGNLDALNLVMDDIRQSPPGTIMCLGDVVGYCADPNACVDVVREVAKMTILGNHDESAVVNQSLEYFNQYAKEAILWTRRQLRDENRDWLGQLPYNHIENNLLFVHSTPYRPEEWNYIFFLGDAELNFRAFQEHICFVGHSHQPVILEKTPDNSILIHRTTRTILNEESQYIINVGSVGQPRDQDPRLSYGIYDTDTRIMEIRRMEYSIVNAQEKMKREGLHPFLIERLALGR